MCFLKLENNWEKINGKSRSLNQSKWDGWHWSQIEVILWFHIANSISALSLLTEVVLWDTSVCQWLDSLTLMWGRIVYPMPLCTDGSVEHTVGTWSFLFWANHGCNRASSIWTGRGTVFRQKGPIFSGIPKIAQSSACVKCRIQNPEMEKCVG